MTAAVTAIAPVSAAGYAATLELSSLSTGTLTVAHTRRGRQHRSRGHRHGHQGRPSGQSGRWRRGR